MGLWVCSELVWKIFRGGPYFEVLTDARIYAEVDGRDRRSAAVLWFERLLLLCGVAGAVGSTLLLRSRAARPAAA